jgi:hypothetical protein
MRWDDTYKSNHEHYQWHDLLDGEGIDTDRLLGYVRHNTTKEGFAEYVAKRLEGNQEEEEGS